MGDSYQQLLAEQQKFLYEAQNKEIDPEQYMNSRSTGTKIANAIGLLLGGISSGVLGGENPAMAAIKMHINNDIDA